MKKKLCMFALSGLLFSLSGCYTSICPTYATHPPEKAKELKTDQAEQTLQALEQPS